MVSFLGIPQSEVIASLESASSFLKNKNIGPRCNTLAALWDAAGENIQQLRAATTDEEFIEAIKATKASGSFSAVQCVFYHYASLDEESTECKLLESLAKWSGVDGQNQFVTKEPAGSYMPAAGGYSIENEELYIEEISTLLPEGNYNLPEGIKPAYGDYGLVFPAESQGLFTDWEAAEQHWQSLADEINKVAAPYIETLAIKNPIYSDPVTVKYYPTAAEGIAVTRATREAAQAIANAFPEYEMVNSLTDEVIPAQGPHANRVTENKKSIAKESSR